MMNNQLLQLLIERLKAKGKTIAVAESCTGGLFSGALTEIPGSSDCFGLGVITYSNLAKHEQLGIPWEILNQFGAVSYQTAFFMAQSVKRLAQSDLGISFTGIAGPSGGTETKPVGLVYMALALEDSCVVRKFYFTGPRHEIRMATVQEGINLVLHYFK
ncbi:CinA family protein [Dehalobacterium formicoaceticum]|uniref:CinA family protein n=1 Tax=Dehalobacterium formicoaceticum TaxID=51515 RepID=A0ABT1Y748_9FIRM|nr:CinA family protein [Dehalobacterium formicoaceticum]MCR6545920.1 CinA family protein [Dehalobacterium formicoaceticum]